jgi:GntR family transcriptional regulator/MocR family aminotransferase
VPSTRDLARQLGVSRRVVVDAYAQLGAEGYLSLRQGAQPRVSDAAPAAAADAHAAPVAPLPRFDLRPSVPDVSTFPRTQWLRSLREAVASITDFDLGYGDPKGVEPLRTGLADYLGRVRGVIADPRHIVVTSGFSQGLGLLCHALAGRGARRIAIEEDCNPDQAEIAARAGLETVSIAVDSEGLRVDELGGVAAVVLTPAHHHPSGVVLSGERRSALVAWLRDRGAYAIEDDYDAEYRYDRAAVGALQSLDPGRVVYAGSASKTLAPALRLGWLVLPGELVEPVAHEKVLADQGTARIEQLAFADFLARGELDRHLRRMRVRYRARRDALIAGLATALPDAQIGGIAAGLHVTVRLPHARATAAEAARRRLALDVVDDDTLLLGYGQLPEAAVPAAVRELAAAAQAGKRDCA